MPAEKPYTEPIKAITTWVPVQVWQELSEMSYKTGRGKRYLLTDALREYINKNKEAEATTSSL